MTERGLLIIVFLDKSGVAPRFGNETADMAKYAPTSGLVFTNLFLPTRLN